MTRAKENAIFLCRDAKTKKEVWNGACCPGLLLLWISAALPSLKTGFYVRTTDVDFHRQTALRGRMNSGNSYIIVMSIIVS